MSIADQPGSNPASSVTFQIRNAGIIVTGSFSDLQTDIHFDPTRPEASSLAATVGPATIHTGITLRDAHLQKRGYFDTEHFPRIQMASKRIQKGSNNCYVGLSHHSDCNEASRSFFCYYPKGTKGHMTGQFRVNRQDFDLGSTSLVLSNEVMVLIDVETGPLVR